MNKVSLPPYVVETPDILQITALRVIPLPPYRLEPLDVLYLSATEVFDLYPVNPPDPLWKLVRDTEDKQRRFATSDPAPGPDSIAGAPAGAEEDAIGALVRKFDEKGEVPATTAPPPPDITGGSIESRPSVSIQL